MITAIIIILLIQTIVLLLWINGLQNRVDVIEGALSSLACSTAEYITKHNVFTHGIGDINDIKKHD